MKDKHAALALIVDKSGSMNNCITDTIGGMNAFIRTQSKVEGSANITLVFFDHMLTTIHDYVDIKTVKEITEEDYIPGGMTALLDAIGITCKNLGDRLAATPEEERPSKVIVAVITDGRENSSKEYNKKAIADMIEHQTSKYNWDFNFISADLAQLNEAKSYGFCDGNMSLYTAENTVAVYSALSAKISRGRAGKSSAFTVLEKRSMAGANTQK